MKGREYVFSHVPEYIWEGFKSAPSLGHYYNAEIRGRYGFDLDEESQGTDGDDEDVDEGPDPDLQYDSYRGR